jgi:hypothetical protein
MAWKQMKMNPEVKKEWLAALRSGKYAQGTQRLNTSSGKFCCLGVLCDLHSKATGTKWKKSTLGNFYISSECALPDAVIAWSGVNYNGGLATINKKLAPLTDHNDEGRTFAEIADAIEKQL